MRIYQLSVFNLITMFTGLYLVVIIAFILSFKIYYDSNIIEDFMDEDVSVLRKTLLVLEQHIRYLSDRLVLEGLNTKTFQERERCVREKKFFQVREDMSKVPKFFLKSGDLVTFMLPANGTWNEEKRVCESVVKGTKCGDAVINCRSPTTSQTYHVAGKPTGSPMICVFPECHELNT